MSGDRYGRTDIKWIRYQATKISKREGISFEEAFETLKNDLNYGKADELVRCAECGVEMKGKNLASHMKKKHKPKTQIQWNRFPAIKMYREKQKRLKKLAGKPQIRIISGGLPGLGKKK